MQCLSQTHLLTSLLELQAVKGVSLDVPGVEVWLFPNMVPLVDVNHQIILPRLVQLAPMKNQRATWKDLASSLLPGSACSCPREGRW